MKISSWMTLAADVKTATNLGDSLARNLGKKATPVACLGLLTLLSACNSEKVEIITGPTMGSTYRVHYVADSTTPDRVQIQTDIKDILHNVNQDVSTYQKDSQVSIFNMAPAGSCRNIPQSVASMYDYAKFLNQESYGAYDITLLPVLSVWGFGPKGRVEKSPSKQQLEDLRYIIGMQNIHMKAAANGPGHQLCKDDENAIEFNSIAAGYAVDRISENLQSKGISSYMIEVTGEVEAKGHKPDGSGWRIALEAPISNKRAAQRIIELDGMSASTSGDYRNYYEENGVRFSHTLDPRTLSPVTHRLASVSVIAKSAMEADGLSTTLMVMGPEQGYEFAVEKQISAMFVINKTEPKKSGKHDGDERSFTVRTTPEFEKQYPRLKGSEKQ